MGGLSRQGRNESRNGTIDSTLRQREMVADEVSERLHLPAGRQVKSAKAAAKEKSSNSLQQEINKSPKERTSRDSRLSRANFIQRIKVAATRAEVLPKERHWYSLPSLSVVLGFEKNLNAPSFAVQCHDFFFIKRQISRN